MKESFEEWYKNYKQSGAFIIAFKEQDKDGCNVHYSGNEIEILYTLEEIIRKLNKKIPKEIIDKCYEIAFEELKGEENE